MVYLLILLSGAAGLIYEIVWIKRSALAFGSNSLALATVLAVFFLGLGLGSYGFGRVGATVRRPLLWCAALELVVACNGLLTPFLFARAEDLYGLAYREWEIDSTALLFVRGGLVALVLLPPTVLIGGTLPLYCRHLVRDPSRIGASIGLTYGINTLGAAIGSAAAGFALIPAMGLTAATQLAAAFNLIAAFGFYRLAAGSGAPAEVSPRPAASAATEPGDANALARYALVGLLFFLIGALALANELLWARFLTNFFRNSVYTYTITLTVVLAGAVLGSLCAAPICDRARGGKSLLLWFAVLQGASAALILILTHLPTAFWIRLHPFRVLPYLILMLPPAIAAGASFPVANRIAINDLSEVPRGVGLLTSLNILGCVVGSLATGFLVLPEFGLDTGIYASTAAGIAAAILAVGAALVSGRPKLPANWLAYTFVVFCILVWWQMPRLSPVQVPKDLIARTEPLLDFAEGYNSTLAVIRRQGAKTLLVSQSWQGSDQKNHQIMAAHVPIMHHPAAKDVLVVGMGVGQTASRFLYHPVDRLDVVDIEPRLFDFVRKNFPSDWMDDPRVRLIAEDGRSYVKHTACRYDILSVEVGQLYRPGVDVFYTREFYREARQRLKPDGLLVQFIPLEFLRPPEFAGVLATFLAEFPAATLWYNTNELLLMGFHSDQRTITPERFERVLRDQRIRSDLDYAYWGGPRFRLNGFPAFLAGFLATGDELRALAEGGLVYTDDWPKLAYRVSDFKIADLRAVTLAGIIQQRLSPLTEAVTADSTDPAVLHAAEGIRRNNAGDMAATNILELAGDGSVLSPPGAVIARANEALQWNPLNLRALKLMGAALIQDNRDNEAIGYLRRAAALDQNDAVTNRKLGFALVRTGLADSALPYLARAIQAQPEDAESVNAMAVALVRLDRLTEAVTHFRRASALQPDNIAATRNLQAAEAMLQQRAATTGSHPGLESQAGPKIP